MARGSSEFTLADITATIQAAINPLTNKIQQLEDKVDILSADRVTRADMDKLAVMFVPRDLYEARHTALVEADRASESDRREIRREATADFQKVHERLESGKQQLEDRMKAHEQAVKTEIKDQSNAQLSDKDRNWMRFAQILSIAATILSCLAFAAQYIVFK